MPGHWEGDLRERARRESLRRLAQRRQEAYLARLEARNARQIHAVAEAFRHPGEAARAVARGAVNVGRGLAALIPPPPGVLPSQQQRELYADLALGTLRGWAEDPTSIAADIVVPAGPIGRVARVAEAAGQAGRAAPKIRVLEAAFRDPLTKRVITTGSAHDPQRIASEVVRRRVDDAPSTFGIDPRGYMVSVEGGRPEFMLTSEVDSRLGIGRHGESSLVMQRPEGEELLRLQRAEAGIDPAGAAAQSVDDQIARLHAERFATDPGATGTTFNPRTSQNMDNADMWAVSPYKDAERTFDHPPTARELESYRAEFADRLQQPSNYVGTWFNTSDGRHYVDISRLVRNKDEALSIGVGADQQGVFHLRTKQYEPVPQVTEQVRAEARADLWDNDPYLNAVRREELTANMTPAERERFLRMEPERQARIERMYSLNPTARERASLAIAGGPNRGWYAGARQVLETFGEDAPRFSALLASLSPVTGVKENLAATLRVWREWVQAGRPTDPAKIEALLSGQVRSRVPNAIKALTATPEQLLDPGILEAGGLLSGPKVDAFIGNLMGYVQRVTLDTHEARTAGVSTKRIADPDRYLAVSASVRAGAREVERLTGTPISPAEMQEMSWSVARGLTERAGQPGVERYLFGSREQPSLFDLFGAEQAGRLPPEELARRAAQETPHIGELIAQEPYAAELRTLGLPVPAPVPPIGLPGTRPGLIRPEDLRAIARRIDLAKGGGSILGLAVAYPFLGSLLGPDRR